MKPKYPKTLHLQGSKGIQDPDQIPLRDLSYIVVEEKLDGSEVSLYFPKGEDRLQIFHRNNPVQGIEFDLLKKWAYSHLYLLKNILKNRYVLFGEWMYSKHTEFYDRLPSYFFAYDVRDSENKIWLSTRKRKDLLSPFNLNHVPILYQGSSSGLESLQDLIAPSKFKSDELEFSLKETCKTLSLDVDLVKKTSDLSKFPEGLYIKEETEEETIGWYKWIRPEFLNLILNNKTHWKERPFLPNSLTK